jgi:xanthine/CO dehydrogenase XdhC/CoxF family maturation factor
MREIIYKLSELVEKKAMAVLATIITQAGSSPRGPGTKMLMMEDGSFVGTIGGGRLEKEVMDVGKEVFSPLPLSCFATACRERMWMQMRCYAAAMRRYLLNPYSRRARIIKHNKGDR